MEESKLLERVRKLLTQAEDPGTTEAEREMFNRKAAELMARHGIDQALLAQSGEIRDEITSVTISIDDPYSNHKARLLDFIAFPLRCRTVGTYHGRAVTRVKVFGYRSDLERVEVLYTSLLLQMTSQLTRLRPDNTSRTLNPENTRSYRVSWMKGFRAAVYQRLVNAEQQATQQHAAETGTSSTGTELALADRAQQVTLAFYAEFGHLPKASTSRHNTSGSGYADGHRAGSQANLGGHSVTEGRRRQIDAN